MKDTLAVATGGLCIALATISLYFASFIPGAELTLYAASSVFVAVMADERGIPGGVLVYVGAAIAGFILMPAKTGVLPFIFFFGIYPIVKLPVEKIKNVPAQFAIKLSTFCAVFFIAYAFFRKLFFDNITLPDAPVILLAACGIVMFFLYDYILTMLVRLYRRRVRHKDPDFKLTK